MTVALPSELAQAHLTVLAAEVSCRAGELSQGRDPADQHAGRELDTTPRRDLDTVRRDGRIVTDSDRSGMPPNRAALDLQRVRGLWILNENPFRLESRFDFRRREGFIHSD